MVSSAASSAVAAAAVVVVVAAAAVHIHRFSAQPVFDLAKNVLALAVSRANHLLRALECAQQAEVPL